MKMRGERATVMRCDWKKHLESIDVLCVLRNNHKYRDTPLWASGEYFKQKYKSVRARVKWTAYYTPSNENLVVSILDSIILVAEGFKDSFIIVGKPDAVGSDQAQVEPAVLQESNQSNASITISMEVEDE